MRLLRALRTLKAREHVEGDVVLQVDQDVEVVESVENVEDFEEDEDELAVT